MDVEIVSKETIRPSSPTPSHLRTFPLSHLDQLSPPFYVPVIYFFPTTTTTTTTNTDTDTNVDQILHRLKLSLCEALSVFYPLAGRIKDHSSVDCNDEGVLFSEAKVSGHLTGFLEQPKRELLDRFLPNVDISMERLNEAVQVAIQVNVFALGGISIGFCFLHRIIDAATIKAFIRCWAAIASGFHNTNNNVVATRSSPADDDDITAAAAAAASLFPPRKSESMDDHVIFLFNLMWLLKKEKGVRRRFVFDATAISALKAKAAAEGTSETVPNLTRFQVVTGFLWKCAMSASRALLDSQKPSSMMLMAVNLRSKMVSPLMSENSIGNFIWLAIAHHREEAAIEKLRSVVDIIRGAIQKINGDFITSLQGEQGLVIVNRAIEELREMYCNEEAPDVYTCSSWCGLGFYDVDFGWGKPIWIAYAEGDISTSSSSSTVLYPNSIVLMDTKSGDGIEAWVLLAESHMEKLQGDQEFLTFATFNPSISIN